MASKYDCNNQKLNPENRFSVVEVNCYPSHTAFSIWDEQTKDYYKDADGLTIDFLSQQLAEDYRLDLIESIQADMLRTPLDKAKDLIDEYCMEEFSTPADFGDLKNVGIGYTTITNNEYPVEASVNLIDFCLERRLNGKVFDTHQYASLEELISHDLYNLDFNDLMDVADDALDAVLDDLDIDDSSAAVRCGGDSHDNLSHYDDRPSVLNDLKEKAGKVVPLTRDARPRREVIL